ncbi:lytic transglycosylase domain-containing protein [Streptomyces sp. NPDC008121]|uniref:aggregation-promoting factor C-terminal-like domain-containing protein n=1 Tax=Streptomyces sp. NPDC008121 TaxID=3364809 RepID=UPI0036E5919C
MLQKIKSLWMASAVAAATILGVATAGPSMAQTGQSHTQASPAQASTPEEARALAKEIVPAGNELACFNMLVTAVTNGTWDVQYKGYTNPGGYGLGQLQERQYAPFGSDWEDNAAPQIHGTVDYAEDRYGSVCGALGFYQANLWY